MNASQSGNGAPLHFGAEERSFHIQTQESNRQVRQERQEVQSRGNAPRNRLADEWRAPRRLHDCLVTNRDLALLAALAVFTLNTIFLIPEIRTSAATKKHEKTLELFFCAISCLFVAISGARNMSSLRPTDSSSATSVVKAPSFVIRTSSFTTPHPQETADFFEGVMTSLTASRPLRGHCASSRPLPALPPRLRALVGEPAAITAIGGRATNADCG